MILRKSMMLFFILLSAHHSASAFPELWDQSPAPLHTLMSFYYRAGDARALTKTDLFFLASNDCSQGLLAHYQSSPSFFPIRPQSFFSLRTDSTYQALSSVLTQDQFPKVNSVLIRFMGENGALPYFLTACADQKINCCIRVRCQSKTATCLPVYAFPTQVFILYQKLIDEAG